jgi:hypothetical protein
MINIIIIIIIIIIVIAIIIVIIIIIKIIIISSLDSAYDTGISVLIIGDYGNGKLRALDLVSNMVTLSTI